MSLALLDTRVPVVAARISLQMAQRPLEAEEVCRLHVVLTWLLSAHKRLSSKPSLSVCPKNKTSFFSSWCYCWCTRCVGLTLQGTQTVKKMTKNPTSCHPLIQDPLENFQTWTLKTSCYQSGIQGGMFPPTFTFLEDFWQWRETLKQN